MFFLPIAVSFGFGGMPTGQHAIEALTTLFHSLNSGLGHLRFRQCEPVVDGNVEIEDEEDIGARTKRGDFLPLSFSRALTSAPLLVYVMLLADVRYCHLRGVVLEE